MGNRCRERGEAGRRRAGEWSGRRREGVSKQHYKRGQIAGPCADRSSARTSFPWMLMFTCLLKWVRVWLSTASISTVLSSARAGGVPLDLRRSMLHWHFCLAFGLVDQHCCPMKDCIPLMGMRLELGLGWWWR